MSKEMIIAVSPHETKVALREDGQVVEVFVEREREVGLVGSIYKGRVTRVLPGMQSAFVDVGLDRDAFLYVSDFEELEEYETLTTASEWEEPLTEAESPSAPSQPPPPVETPQATAERQPDFEQSEPPLILPEHRPLGRGPHRRRRPRHRGGRSRHRRGPLPQRDQARDRVSAAPYEPVILPGESLAKYRDRVPQPAESEPTQSPQNTSENSSSDNPGKDAARGAASPSSQAPQDADRNPAPEETQAEAGQEPASQESPPAIPSPREAEPRSSGRSVRPEESKTETDAEPTAQEPRPDSLSPSREKLPSEPEAQPEISAEPERSAQGAASEPTNNNYPEATTLAEIERVRRYEREISLPPSVEERTAGGVEWQHAPGGYRRRRGRGRYGRGRGREYRREDRGRGARPRLHARPTRGQPAIAELLRAGQEIIVQIAKEQMGKKGARITSHVTLPGRFLVYMPTIEHIGISRKIGTREERNRLRRLLLELKGRITGGFVVRTAAAGCSEDDLHQDIDYLVKLWHDIRLQAEETPAPTLLHRDLNLAERVLRDHITADYEGVWIDSEEEYTKVVEFVGRLQPGLASRIKLYTRPAPVFEEMGVQQEIERALRPKVWLKSGGYIVINHTEALVAIDVNTGKFVGKGSTRLEDTIVKTNLEAVKEIVRQIRLRDLGGIIVIDFIDMEDRRNRQRVMSALEEALRADRSPSKLLAFNEFGLVAITRKRSRQPLERLLCQPCPYCTGTGMVKSIPTLCYEIQGETRKMAETIDAPELTIRAHPDIVKALKGHDGALVRELEEQTGKNIILQPDTGLHFEQYNIY